MQRSLERSWSRRARCRYGAGLFLLLLARFTWAQTPERTAVIIVSLSPRNEDAKLADGLTELAIATVAERAPAELIGTAEVLRRLNMSAAAAASCLERDDCRKRAAATMGAGRVLTGALTTREDGFAIQLVMHDVLGGAIERRITRQVDGSIDDLLTAVRGATIEVISPPPAAGTLSIAAPAGPSRVFVNGKLSEAAGGMTLEPGAHTVRVLHRGYLPWQTQVQLAAGQQMALQLRVDDLTPRLRWPSRVAHGAAAAGLAALAAGVWLGMQAQATPSGATRRQRQEDFQRRRAYGLGAELSFVAAGLMGAAAAVTVVAFKEHVFAQD